MARHPTELTQFESPHFVDICRGKQQTTLLCGGLPYHRRFGPRKLDTLLVTQGETARTFRLGIGIDVPNSPAAALGFLAPPLVLPDQPPTPTSTGWLFHLDCRNVLATHWEPVDNSRGLTAPGESEQTLPAGETAFRVRLLETDGRGVRLGLRCFRSVAAGARSILARCRRWIWRWKATGSTFPWARINGSKSKFASRRDDQACATAALGRENAPAQPGPVSITL